MGAPDEAAEVKARALAYLEKSGTRAPLADLRRKLGATLAAFENLLAKVGEEEARRRPAPGKWSVQEVADHLIESHAPAIPQIRASLAGQDPGPAIPAHLQSADPLAKPYAEVVEELKK